MNNIKSYKKSITYFEYDIYKEPCKYGKYYNRSKNKKIKIKSKKRGHRKRKYGNQESISITFRIGKKFYIENKKEIRKTITDKIMELFLNYNLEKKIKEFEKELLRLKKN